MAVHPPEEPGLAGQVGRAGPNLERLRATVEAGHRAGARRRGEVAQERPQEGGFAGAVGSEEPEDLPLAHLERAAVEGGELPVSLREADGADDHRRLEGLETPKA